MIDKQSIQMNQLQRLIEDVDKVAQEHGSPPPGEFLANVMAGRDPRPVDSPLFTLVKGIAYREFTGAGDPFPSPDEWQLIVEIVLGSEDYQKAPVSIEHSMRAGEKLMEYLHAKMKRVEVQGALDVQLRVEPLTGDDLEAFRERFNKDF